MRLSSVVKDRILSDIAARGDEREAFPRAARPDPLLQSAGRLRADRRCRRQSCSKGLGSKSSAMSCPTISCAPPGMISATNLVVRRRFGDGPVIALNAHGDVVAPGEGWTHPPFGAEVADGVMYGRGVAVSKSDFATYAFALLALASRRRAV